MANSTLIQNSCICMYAFKGPPLTTKQNQDQLIIRISISLGYVQENLARRRSPLIHPVSTKTFSYPRRAFQGDIIRNIIHGLEIPFPLENLIWGLDFPPDEAGSRHETLDAITTDRLSEIALCCAENDQIGYMSIAIRKLVKLKPEKYREVCEVERRPLDDWILENMDDVNSFRCLWFIHKLHRVSSKDDEYYGLKSVMVTSERECSICMGGLKKNTQAISMSCSHIFHGLCIFKWLERRPNCPLCRKKLALP